MGLIRFSATIDAPSSCRQACRISPAAATAVSIALAGYYVRSNAVVLAAFAVDAVSLELGLLCCCRHHCRLFPQTVRGCSAAAATVAISPQGPTSVPLTCSRRWLQTSSALTALPPLLLPLILLSTLLLCHFCCHRLRQFIKLPSGLPWFLRCYCCCLHCAHRSPGSFGCCALPSFAVAAVSLELVPIHHCCCGHHCCASLQSFQCCSAADAAVDIVFMVGLIVLCLLVTQSSKNYNPHKLHAWFWFQRCCEILIFTRCNRGFGFGSAPKIPVGLSRSGSTGFCTSPLIFPLLPPPLPPVAVKTTAHQAFHVCPAVAIALAPTGHQGHFAVVLSPHYMLPVSHQIWALPAAVPTFSGSRLL